MTSRYLSVTRSVLVALTAAAIVCVPVTGALAQQTIDDARPASGLAVKDGTGSLNQGDGSNINRIRSYPRSNYIWPYAGGPSYPSVDVEQPGVVWTPAGVFQLQGALPIAQELRTPTRFAERGSQVSIVLFQPELDVENDLKRIIERSGGIALTSPNDGVLVARLTPEAHAAVQSSVGFLGVAPYHAAFKLNPKIGRTPLPDPIRALSDVYTLEVLLWKGSDAQAAEQAVRAIGGTVLRNYGDQLVIELNRSLLPDLADLDAVRYVHESLPLHPMGEETTTTMQTGQYNGGATPFHDAGITGAGLGLCDNDLVTQCTVATQTTDCGLGNRCIGEQVLMVLDSGFQLDAGDLSDTKVDAGTASLTHRKVREHASTVQFGGQGDLTGCDSPPQGGFTHGHVVSATALGNATDVSTDYGATGWNAFDPQGNPWKLDGVAPGAVLVGYDGQITPPNGSCSDPLLDSIFPGDLYQSGVSGPCPGGTCPGSLGQAYTDNGARVVNFSWGSLDNVYTAGAADIDQFIWDKGDALVFVSAGNQGADNVPEGGDGIPDTETLGAPATTKNGFAIGASRNADTTNQPESRAFFSSMGPAVDTTTNRIAPQLMAPGDELAGGGLGVSSEFACRTNDNDQDNPVNCDIISGSEGTSFAAPAAAGAALLARDYFRLGFHPKAVYTPTDTFEIGGAFLKSLLIASADYMSGANLTRAHRWNNEQGYGRIQLDNALPLETWPRSPTGLLVHDPFAAVTDLGLPFSISTGQTQSTTFKVVNDDEELRIALAWIDEPGAAALRRDINLKLVSPSGIEYRGNYFTDDNDQDGVPETNEDCGGIGAPDVEAANGLIDQDQWSLPVCSRTRVQGKAGALRLFDNSNVSEAIFLSPDPQGDNGTTGGFEGTCTPTSTANANGPCDNNLDCRATLPGNPGDGECDNYEDYKQTELGEWSLFIQSGGLIPTPIGYAVAVTGGVSLGSTVRFDDGTYTCNADATLTVSELLDVGSAGTDNPTESDVSDRTTVEVIDGDPDSATFGQVVDTEDGFTFTQSPAGLKFESDPIQLTDGTARDPGNGVLDIRDGDQLRVMYMDADVETPGLPLTIQRQNSASVNCTVNIGFGSIVFAQFGQDSSTLVQGGCERNVRGEFFFGFPDRYMDAGESVIFNFAFNSNETLDLENVRASLRCVDIDDDSPAGCLPSGAGCDETLPPPEGCGGPCDPLRENNPECNWLTILDSPEGGKPIGFVPAGAALSANFSIQMGGDGPGEPFEDTGGGQPTPTVEMLLEVAADVSGNTNTGLAVDRIRLNVDELSTLYSTDYPAGGTEVLDHNAGVASNNDEIAKNPVSELANWQSNDYRFETFVFAPLNSGTDVDGNPATPNTNLLSPWDFDGDNGGFTVGLAAPADETAADIFNIHNWGEDKNFNGIEDGICEAEPSIACYNFGTGTDVRCPAGTACVSVENNGGGVAFVNNWSTKGGCGWQTRATGECTGDDTRGCFVDDDCKGTCFVVNNEIASTFDPCFVDGDCPDALACSDLADNPLAPCTDDSDCGDGGLFDTCDPVGQECLGAAGTCGAIVGDHTGGVWHTGEIGTPDQVCNGTAASACANYKVIAGTGGNLLWWELLVTPVMEKVNQEIGDDGLPVSTIEITDWGWNAQVNVRDSNVIWTWELDTDITTLDPVDLFADSTILNSGGGAYGAIDLGSNPDLTNGWPIFAPQCRCTKSPFGTCTTLFECAPGACAVSGNDCWVDADCDPGECSISGTDCFQNSDCPQGECDAGGDGTAEGEPCNTNQDCIDIAGPGATCTGSPETCTAGGPSGNGPETCSNPPTCDCSVLDSVNGSLGGSRVGEAGCFFEGNIDPTAYIDLGTALPRDDDIDNDEDGNEAGLPGGAYDCNDGIDNDGDTFTDLDDPECILWIDTTPGAQNERHGLDEFVQVDGPYRTQDIVSFNGPDMRLATLEDIYGDTGNNFQAAIGFVNFEGTPSSQAQQSYGLAVDDMVVKWREFTLEPDATDCTASGSCAVVELATSNIFQGQTVLTITVLEQTPDPSNDCDLDGALDATIDCNSNGVPDVVVKSTSDVEIAGEISYLDRVGGSGSTEYKGFITVSSLSDSPGVLFIAQQGTENPAVTVTYKDNDIDPTPGAACVDDGDCTTGNQTTCYGNECVEECPNDNNPANHGFVQTASTIFLGTTCDVLVVYPEITDNGDNDAFPDTEETVSTQLCVINNCGIDLHNCSGRVFSNSPEVDCIVDATIDVGGLPANPELVCITDPFLWKVADVDRTDLGLTIDDDFRACFNFTMTCDEIDALSVTQEFCMELDLDLDTGGQPIVAWTEGFEGSISGTLAGTSFTAENLDEGLPGNNNSEGHINSDGWRCQYSDPDWVNSNSYGNDIALDCFPGMNLAHANAIWWGVDGFDTGAPDGGRAKTGNYSMYYGQYVGADADFTTPMAVVESVATPSAINLGAAPTLSWWQQISLMDGRYVNINASRNAGRGVVQYKTVDVGGSDTSVWTRLQPFINSYDTQNYDYYFNCMFDPVDDGTTEDDFFDPSDPDRRLGPSSTCHPGFNYSCIGDTDQPFQVENICNAITEPGPGDAGALGTGTWVQSLVDLRALKGKRIKLRYLVSDIKASAETHDGQFDGVNPGPWDDGWWIDDVRISETLSDPADITLDDKIVRHCAGDDTVGCIVDQDCVDAGTTGPCEGLAPQCPGTCTTLTVGIETEPDLTGGPLDELLSAPGQPIELDASSSTGTCLGGSLLYRFSVVGGDVLREYSENPVFVDAPSVDTDYRVDVSCSADAAGLCDNFAVVDVNVNCPSTGNVSLGVFPVIQATSKNPLTGSATWGWTPSKSYLLHVGNLPVTPAYAGTQTAGSGTSFTHAPVGNFYYLVREVGPFCNASGLWTSGGTGEQPGRDTTLP